MYVGLTAYTLVDAIQHPDSRPFGVPRPVWMAAIIVLPLVGALAWMVAKFRGPAPDTGIGSPPPPGPEDDPEYIEWLEREERRRRRERGDDAPESP